MAQGDSLSGLKNGGPSEDPLSDVVVGDANGEAVRKTTVAANEYKQQQAISEEEAKRRHAQGLDPKTGRPYTQEQATDSYNRAYRKGMVDGGSEKINQGAITRNNLAGREQTFWDMAQGADQRLAPKTNYAQYDANMARGRSALGASSVAFGQAQGAVGQGVQTMGGVNPMYRRAEGALGASTGALGQGQQIRADQLAQMQYLQRMQAGEGPTVAGLQLQQGSEAAIRAQNSMASGARGPAMAGALYAAQNNAGDIMAQTNQQAAQLRAQEQLNATGQLNEMGYNIRGQDLATSQGLREIGQGYQANAAGIRDAAGMYGQLGGQLSGIGGEMRQTGLGYGTLADSEAARTQFDADLSLRQRGMNDTREATFFGMANQMDEADYQARLEAERLRTDNYLRLKGAQLGRAPKQETDNTGAYIGAGATLGGIVLASALSGGTDDAPAAGNAKPAATKGTR